MTFHVVLHLSFFMRSILFHFLLLHINYGHLWLDFFASGAPLEIYLLGNLVTCTCCMWWTCWYASSLSAISFVAINKLHPLLIRLRTKSINEPDGCTNAVKCHVPMSFTMMSVVNGIDSEALWLIWQCLYVFRSLIADVELQSCRLTANRVHYPVFYCALWPQHNHWSTAAVHSAHCQSVCIWTRAQTG